MADVTLSKIEKRFGSVSVIQGLDLDVADKEFMVLVGPSGCGKSTALRMIAGLEEVSDGTISIGGRVVNDVPPKDRDIRQRVAVGRAIVRKPSVFLFDEPLACSWRTGGSHV